MLIDELNKYIAKEVENTDVSEIYKEIKKVALNKEIRLYPIDLLGRITVNPLHYVTKEQAQKLQIEGFTVEYISNGRGADHYLVTW